MPMQEAAAQDPVGGAIIGGATGAAIGAEGEPRPGGYRYYQDACYQPQPDGAWLAVSPEYCAPAPDYAQDSGGIAVDVAPPPLPVYDQPPIPAPGYIWTPGYWAWDDATGYYWVPGTWVLPPEQATRAAIGAAALSSTTAPSTTSRTCRSATSTTRPSSSTTLPT